LYLYRFCLFSFPCCRRYVLLLGLTQAIDHYFPRPPRLWAAPHSQLDDGLSGSVHRRDGVRPYGGSKINDGATQVRHSTRSQRSRRGPNLSLPGPGLLTSPVQVCFLCTHSAIVFCRVDTKVGFDWWAGGGKCREVSVIHDACL